MEQVDRRVSATGRRLVTGRQIDRDPHLGRIAQQVRPQRFDRHGVQDDGAGPGGDGGARRRARESERQEGCDQGLAARDLEHASILDQLPATTGCRILPRQPEAHVLSTRRFGLAVRFLSVALLVGQVGAAAHAYSHLSDGAKHRPDTTQICGACMSFAPLASAVGGSTATLQFDHCGSDAAVPAANAAIALDPHYPAFRSRAPPAIL